MIRNIPLLKTSYPNIFQLTPNHFSKDLNIFIKPYPWFISQTLKSLIQRLFLFKLIAPYNQLETPVPTVCVLQAMFKLAAGTLSWVLIITSVISNFTLVLKIWRRKNLHSVFNMSMCFYFLWVGTCSPMLYYEYSNLLIEMMKHPESVFPGICKNILVLRMLSFQVFIINLLFR